MERKERLMLEVTLSKSERFVRAKIQHYNETKYWKYRSQVISCGGGGISLEPEYVS